MSENFNQQADPQPKRDAVWYKLDGKSEQALRRVIDASQSGEEMTREEKRELGRALGYFSPVLQTQNWFGPMEDYAVFPATFGHPFSQQDEFFMKCPVGGTRDEEQTHFVPEDATPLTDEEAANLERMLFPAQGAAVPITGKLPMQLKPANEETANKPPSPNNS